MPKRKITDAIEILNERYRHLDPNWDKDVAEEKLKLRVGIAICKLREDSGLTQKELADLCGVTQAMISQLENADYDGSVLDMLWRVCRALDRELDFTCREPGTGRETCRVALTPG